MAAHRDALGRHRTASGRLAARTPRTPEKAAFSIRSRCARRRTRRLISRACSAQTVAPSSIPPSWPSNSPARARMQACRSTNARTPPGWTPAGSALRVDTATATITARQAVLATNVYPSLLRRNRLRTVPVYDYVLATEPLTDAQLDRIGWQDRQGIGDCANQFHYYRLTKDNRIVWGGYDAVYHFGAQGRSRLRGPASHIPAASPRTSSSPSPNSTTSGSRTAGLGPSTPTRGSARTGVWPATTGWRTSTGSPASGWARRGSPPTCALTFSRALPPHAPSCRWCANARCRSRPNRSPASGIQATRWSLDRADHSAGRRNIFLRTLDALGLGFDS